MHFIAHLVLRIDFLLLGGVLGASALDGVVNGRNFSAEVPASIERARAYMTPANPGTYFRRMAPATAVGLLVGAAVCWPLRPVRWWMVGALVTMASADLITMRVHLPRNAFLFTGSHDKDPTLLAKAAREWKRWNWVRVGLLTVAMSLLVQAAFALGAG